MLTIPASSAQPRFASSLKSPLPGVSLAAWQRFVSALEVQRMDQVSARGGFGSYDLRPKRLEEIGYVTDLARQGGRRQRGKPQVYACRFLPPWSRERFLADASAQIEALSKSMRGYAEDLAAGRLQQPDGLSLAGALAILHVGGRGALAAFPDLFDHTRAVCERARGAF